MSVARVARIDNVEPHPNPSGHKMSVLTVGDLKGVSQNIGEHFDVPRYKIGDLVVIMTKNAVLPDDVLKMGFWDENRENKDGSKGAGMLAKDDGARKGARVADKKFHGFNSQFITFPTTTKLSFIDGEHQFIFVQRGEETMRVQEGIDVMAFFGVVEFAP